MVELGEGPECARHHPAGVEEDQQTLLPLGLVLDGDRPAPPRGRGPRDRAWVIVGSVFAKSREEAARARDARTPLAGVIRQTAAQGDLVAADLAQVGVDLHLHGGVHAATALHEPERTGLPRVEIPELERAPVPRSRRVFGAGRGATPDLDTDRAAVDVEGGRRLISDREGKTAGERVPDREADRICGAERRLLGDLA